MLVFKSDAPRDAPSVGHRRWTDPLGVQEHAEAVLHACVALAASLVADKEAASTAHTLVTPVLLLHAALLLTPTVPLELQVRCTVACTFLRCQRAWVKQRPGLSTLPPSTARRCPPLRGLVARGAASQGGADCQDGAVCASPHPQVCASWSTATNQLN